ncbi:ABC-2 transporter permease [Paenibacillus chitinolyticus]|uniref:ABC-2 transporter permease n=1 Tax=Paenibacillus chitinolyticus TaxID=79263 RepID=A0A410WUI1_9BACL|nr:ABC-2 transporter permease [Paenibacillus chitinolyticus]MCY9591850.1 ABC-2 transporter permease [Paenibacillus chitinolyticus]MCY9595150.1 ABC-2 transporter permease [Paenibacillus chitinolyticus]QAV18012.1 ABC-2 transporter permease [Paenibacillus chitinolyticus]
MVALLSKDFRVMRKELLWMAVYVVFFAITFSNSRMGGVVVQLVPSIMLLFISANHDVKNRNFILLGSLPVRRSDIVRARYVSVLLFGVLGAGIGFIVSTVTSMIQGTGGASSFSWGASGLLGAMLLVYAAIYLPLHYWLGDKYLQVISVIMMILLFASTSMLGFIVGATDKWGLPSPAAVAVIALTGVSVFFVSYLISLGIMKKKDF